MDNILTLISIILSAAMALYAVFIGGRIQIQFAQDEAIKKELEERLKMLSLVQHELTLNKTFREEGKGDFRSRKFYTGELLIRSSCFSVDSHVKLLQLTLEVNRHFDMLNIAIDHMQMISSYSSAQSSNPGFFKWLTNFVSPEAAVTKENAINNMMKNTVEESGAKELNSISNELLKLIDADEIPRAAEELNNHIVAVQRKRNSFSYWLGFYKS